MVRIADLPELSQPFLLNMECPTFDTRPWVEGPPLAERRIAMVTTAGLARRTDAPFIMDDAQYRVIPGDVDGAELVMSHASINFDRSGFLEDLNVAFPIDRMRQLAADGTIGSLADFHYAFMGATYPEKMKSAVGPVAELLRADGVDSIFLVGV